MNGLRRYRKRLFLPGGMLLLLAVVVVTGILAAPGCTPSAQDTTRGRQPGPLVPTDLTPAPEAGRLAPDFTLTDLEGNRFTLSDYRGKVVFINFWATWCPACRAEMPEIEAVVVVGVDIMETEDTVRQFVEQGGYSWTFVIDTTGEVSNNYEVTAIPTSFFIDREGVIRAVKIGSMTKRAMEARLLEAMR